jgi:hypothetical protein
MDSDDEWLRELLGAEEAQSQRADEPSVWLRELLSTNRLRGPGKATPT